MNRKKVTEKPGDLCTDRFAELLVSHSLRVRRGEAVAIHATPLAEELIRAVYVAVLRRGAFPWLRLQCPGLRGAFLRHASAKWRKHPHPVEWAEAHQPVKQLTILSVADPREMESADPLKLAEFLASRSELQRQVRRAGWCLTLWPTPAYARDAGMSLAKYREFFFRAVRADVADPAAAWREVDRQQRRLIRRLQPVREIRLRGPGTDLALRVAGRRWVSCFGRTNMPDGEVFCAPDETSAEGVVTYHWPVCHQGREVREVRLRFRRGRVVEAHAAKNEDYLHKYLALDAGAHRLGELGVGTNFRIQQITRTILFDEKIGGTVHLALGSGGRVKSAVHWDMICDLRHGVALADGQPFIQNGKLIGWDEG